MITFIIYSCEAATQGLNTKQESTQARHQHPTYIAVRSRGPLDPWTRGPVDPWTRGPYAR